MTEIVSTLKKCAAALEREGIPYLLGGSVACWARGAPAADADLDFVIKPADRECALGALCRVGMREERPPEQWLFKAWDGETLVDLIFEPAGLPITDDVMSRGENLNVGGMWVPVMALDDVITAKLLALDEHALDFGQLVQIARALREQIDWPHVRSRTEQSPYARAFFTLAEGLGVAPGAVSESSERPQVRLASS